MASSITVSDMIKFVEETEILIEKVIAAGNPVGVMGSYNCDNGFGCIMFSQWNGVTTMDTIHTSFKIDDRIMEFASRVKQRLLDAGLLIDDKYVDGATHIVVISHGTWAHNGMPVLNEYRFKGDDVSAALATIQFGGRLKKLEPEVCSGVVQR